MITGWRESAKRIPFCLNREVRGLYETAEEGAQTAAKSDLTRTVMRGVSYFCVYDFMGCGYLEGRDTSRVWHARPPGVGMPVTSRVWYVRSGFWGGVGRFGG